MNKSGEVEITYVILSCNNTNNICLYKLLKTIEILIQKIKNRDYENYRNPMPRK